MRQMKMREECNVAYEILWKDQTYRINKNEKWTKISRSKLVAYLKVKYPDPAEREMKEIELSLGHEVETNTFKCRNAEFNTSSPSIKKYKIYSEDIDSGVYLPPTKSGTSYNIDGRFWSKDLSVYAKAPPAVAKDEWPPIGYKHGDWEMDQYFYDENMEISSAHWYRKQDCMFYLSSDPSFRPRSAWNKTE